MALPPHWMDEVIDQVIASNDASQIAQAIANSPQLIDAITMGLIEGRQQAAMEKQTGHMICGAGSSQMIRRKVQEAIESLS